MDDDRNDWTRVAVGILLVAQVILFLISVSSFMAISVFCSVTAGRAPPLFALIHLAYAGLFLFGVVSLFWRPGRKIYIILIVVALMALPVQLWLLDSGYLQCDGFAKGDAPAQLR